MRGTIRIGNIMATYLPELLRILLASAISIAATTYIITTYFYKPIVLLDLQALRSDAVHESQSIQDDQAKVEYVAKYFDRLAKDIKNRKEIVVVKAAIVNSEQFKDITDEYKGSNFNKENKQ